MSHIFDALQRSEVSRTESDVPLSLAAIELLEGAERAAASQARAEEKTERAAGFQRDCANVIFGPDCYGRLAGLDHGALTQAFESLERSESFSQFQALTVSVSEKSHLVCLSDIHCPAAEAFRLLGVRLRHLRLRRAVKTLLVTSTIPREGKSTVAANLACTLASGEQQKVLLLEGDVRRPSLAQLFGLPSVAGLSNCLQGDRTLPQSVYRLEEPGIWILPAGDKAGAPLELIQSPRLAALLQKLNAWFDWIVIDSPPVLPLADTSEWARLADGVLLVARRAITDKRKLQKGLEALDRSKLIGAIVNSSRGANGDYYYYRPNSDISGQSKADAR